MNDHSIPLSIVADLLEQSDERALRDLDQAELIRLRSVLRKTLAAIDGRLTETRTDEILSILPTLTLAADPSRWNA